MSKPLVLIVEDSKFCADYLAALLKSNGVRVHIETTLGGARAWLSSNPVLLMAVVDINLGAESGLDLLPLLAHVPVVIASTTRVRVSGNVAFVHKGPLWAARIEAKMKALLAS
jgi:DNA-binding response OmpR family regulator